MNNTPENYFSQETERLTFRKLTKNDIQEWSRFFVNNDRTHFVGAAQFVHLNEMEKATNWIQSQMDRYAADNFGQLAMIEKESGKFIGVSGLIVRELEEGKKDYEVTYSLLPECWSKGFATEAAIHFKSYAFNELGCKSVISIIHADNQPSENVALKNGMQKTVAMEFMGMPVNVYKVVNYEL